MNYQEFIYSVECAVKKDLPENFSAQIHNVTKNNGNERVGLAITGEESNLSPTIYLEEFYEKYQEGETIEEIVEQIFLIYHDVKVNTRWEPKSLLDYEAVKDKIAYKLINAKKNEEMLETTPHRTILDLAIVCYVLLEIDEMGTATVLVTEDILRLWDIDEDTLFERAKHNTQRLLPEQFCAMKAILMEFCDGSMKLPEESDGLYVLTNERKHLGAICMLYPEVLKNIGKQLGENYYIIPSSIHEVIIVPEHFSPGREGLKEMIAEVNETQVEAEEVLSNVPYYYDRNEERLVL